MRVLKTQIADEPKIQTSHDSVQIFTDHTANNQHTIDIKITIKSCALLIQIDIAILPCQGYVHRLIRHILNRNDLHFIESPEQEKNKAEQALFHYSFVPVRWALLCA
jgi:hypothetical protein